MQHLHFFLYNKSNPFMIPHAARSPKILFPSDPEIAIPSKSVTSKQPLCAFCVKIGSIFLQSRFIYPTFLCEMLKFCCSFLLILFGIS